MSNNENNNNLQAIDSEQEKVLFEQLSGRYTENRDIANQLLGRIQMAQGISKLTTAVSLVDLQKVKEGKLYKALKGQSVILGDGTKIDDVGTWEGFCKSIGTSKSKIDEDILNLKEFGVDAMEQLTKVGMGVRDLRALRQLPDDQQQQVIESEAVEVQDKEAVQELIDELKTSHQAQTSKLNKEKLELKNSNDIKTSLNDKMQGEITDLKEQLEARNFSADGWKTEAKQTLIEVNTYVANAKEALLKLAQFREYIFEADDLPQEALEVLAGSCIDMATDLAEHAALFFTDTDQMLAAFKPARKPSFEYIEMLSQQALDSNKG